MTCFAGPFGSAAELLAPVGITFAVWTCSSLAVQQALRVAGHRFRSTESHCCCAGSARPGSDATQYRDPCQGTHKCPQMRTCSVEFTPRSPPGQNGPRHGQHRLASRPGSQHPDRGERTTRPEFHCVCITIPHTHATRPPHPIDGTTRAARASPKVRRAAPGAEFMRIHAERETLDGGMTGRRQHPPARAGLPPFIDFTPAHAPGPDSGLLTYTNRGPTMWA